MAKKKKSKKKAKSRSRKKGGGGLLSQTDPNPAQAAADAGADPKTDGDDSENRDPLVRGAGKNKKANDTLAAAIGKHVRGNNWIPKVENDAIYGQVHDAVWKTNQNGRFLSVILEVTDEKGTADFVNILCNRVMRTQFNDEGVRVGDMIAIAYKGKQTGKRGAPYRLYAVANETREDDHDGQHLVTQEDIDAEV